MNRLELERPRDIPALFGDALGVYARHVGAFLALAAAIVVPVDLIVLGLGLEQLSAGYDDSPSAAETAIPALVSLLVIAPLITAACIHALRAVAAGERPGAGRTLSAGLEAFTPIFLAVVLAALGIAAGLLLLILPGLYLGVRWYFVPQAVVLEGERGPAALGRSGQAVSGFWWRTFGIVLLANLAVTLPGLLLVAPFSAISAAADRELWGLVGQITAEVLTAPFVALVSTLLYYDLRARRAAAPL